MYRKPVYSQFTAEFLILPEIFNNAAPTKESFCAIRIAAFHYDDMPGCKNGNFQMKNCDIFLIFALNIDCGASLRLF